MRKFKSSMLILLLLLQACTVVPRVLIQRVCPAIPPLDQQPAALEPSFIDRMQDFLRGNLPEETEYSLTSPNAKLPTAQPVKP